MGREFGQRRRGFLLPGNPGGGCTFKHRALQPWAAPACERWIGAGASVAASGMRLEYAPAWQRKERATEGWGAKGERAKERERGRERGRAKGERERELQ